MTTIVRTLLIVDDDVLARRALTRTLTDPAYRIVHAENPKQALAILEKEKIQVVLSDYHMGFDSGATFLAEVERRFPNVVRLLLTSDTATDVMVAAVNEGRARRVLYKPWHDDQLRAAVRQAFGLPRVPVREPGVYNVKSMSKITVTRIAALLGVEMADDTSTG